MHIYLSVVPSCSLRTWGRCYGVEVAPVLTLPFRASDALYIVRIGHYSGVEIQVSQVTKMASGVHVCTWRRNSLYLR